MRCSLTRSLFSVRASQSPRPRKTRTSPRSVYCHRGSYPMIHQFAHEYSGPFQGSITVNEALETSRGRQHQLQDVRTCLTCRVEAWRTRPLSHVSQGRGDTAGHWRGPSARPSLCQALLCVTPSLALQVGYSGEGQCKTLETSRLRPFSAQVLWGRTIQDTGN